MRHSVSRPVCYDTLTSPRFANVPLVCALFFDSQAFTSALLRGCSQLSVSSCFILSFLAALLFFGSGSLCFWLGRAMAQQDAVWTTDIGGRVCIWTRVPNQRTRSGFSWTTPSVVSAAGFSSVVPPLSGHPHDVGWPILGAGLLIVYSHDGHLGSMALAFSCLGQRNLMEQIRFWLKTTTLQSRFFSPAFCPLPDGGQTY